MSSNHFSQNPSIFNHVPHFLPWPCVKSVTSLAYFMQSLCTSHQNEHIKMWRPGPRGRR